MSKRNEAGQDRGALLPFYEEPKEPQPVRPFERIVSQGQVSVLFNGTLFMSYRERDEILSRLAAVKCALEGMASQTDIATLWGVHRRTVVKWIALYRQHGIKGLIGAAGRPGKVDDQLRRKIAQMRSNRVDINQIAKSLGISRGLVCEVLYGRLKQVEQVELEGFSSAEAEKSEAVLPEVDAEGEPVAEPAPSDEVAQVYAEGEASGMTAGETLVNPLDRREDRMRAYAGLTEEATPIFDPHQQVAVAGCLLALALFFKHGFLERAKGVYGSFGPAFYGVRSIFCTLFLMAVARIINPEKLNSFSPLRLGRLLGLDRSPSVKTLRCKLKALAQRTLAGELMNKEAEHLLGGYDAEQVVLLADGHVYPYHGEGKLGKVFSTAKNRVVKGGTDYWMNLVDGTPLLCIPTEFNQHLNRMLPALVEAAQEVCGERKLTVIFDRGGADAAAYEKLINEQVCDFIAYHKNPEPISPERFEPRSVEINGRTYDVAPYERSIKLDVYEGQGRRRRKTGRQVALREIIVRREDGKTTHLITTHEDWVPEKVASTLFSRWSQENFFKYMKQTYQLDHLYTYAKRSVLPGSDHPNPEYTQLEKQARSLREKIGRILGRHLPEIASEEASVIQEQIDKLKTGKTAEKLKKYAHMLVQTCAAMKQTPERESTDHYQVVDTETRLLGMFVKCAAYRCEGELAEMVKDIHPLRNGNYRGIVDALMKTTGELCLEPGILRIKLQAQATPKRTQILDQLCQRISEMKIEYPDAGRIMLFEVAKN